MKDHYLRSSSADEMRDALVAAKVADSDGNPVLGIDLAMIGTIIRDGAQLPGFHANLRSSVELQDWQLSALPLIERPANPVCVWFDPA